MKKVLSVLIALMMFVMMAVPAMAAEGDFVKSIGYKDQPELVEFVGPDGKTYIGTLRDANGNVVGYVGADCFLITAVADVDKADKLPTEAAALLKKVYEALKNGSMKLPYDKVGLDPSKMVIRDLFDVTFLCSEHPEALAPKGVTLDITLKLGVKRNVNVIAFSYKNDSWVAVNKAVNNGDGTVTFTFEDFCPVAIAVPVSSVAGSGTGTGDTANVGLWAGLMVVAAAGIGVMVVASRRKKA